MVIDLKGMIAGALLERYGETPLGKIAISGMQKRSGVSRRTFLHHFLDKKHLIYDIYLDRPIRNPFRLAVFAPCY